MLIHQQEKTHHQIKKNYYIEHRMPWLQPYLVKNTRTYHDAVILFHILSSCLLRPVCWSVKFPDVFILFQLPCYLLHTIKEIDSSLELIFSSRESSRDGNTTFIKGSCINSSLIFSMGTYSLFLCSVSSRWTSRELRLSLNEAEM